MYEELADRMAAAVRNMTPLQREGIRRCTDLDSPSHPEAMYLVINRTEDNRYMIERLREALGPSEGLEAEPVRDIQVALDQLSPDDWRAVSSSMFVLFRGNAYDDPCEYVEGGGLLFPKLHGRYALFFQWLDEERQRIGSDATVFDVGCYQGVLLCGLLQRGYAAGGVDVCGEVQSVITERLLHLKPEHAARFLGYSCGWAHEALEKFQAGAFSIVTAQETLEHIPTQFLQQTCDQMLRAARHSVLVEVPGWDDGWPLHLRVYTVDDLERLFVRDGWEMTLLQRPGGGVYTTVKVVRI